MIFLLATLLVILNLGIVLYPLVYPNFSQRSKEEAEQLVSARLRRARERIYEEMRILQQEYFLNTLPGKEYKTQLANLRRSAAILLREQETLQDTLIQLDANAEQELQALGIDPAKPS